MERLVISKAPPIVLLAGALLAAAPARPELSPARAAAPTASLSADAIISHLIEHNQRRDQFLAGYEVARRYHLKNALYEKEVLMEVDVTFRAPDQLSFEIRRREGSDFLARRVFGRMMEGEQESLQAENKRRSALTRENYEFELAGIDSLDGRTAYRFDIVPRREDAFLFAGRIWVDAEDFAVVRAEGEPAKRPSFWTRQIDFVRTFKKVGPFWLPARTESVTEVLLFGTSSVTVENDDYHVRLNNAAAATAEQP